MPLEDAGTGGGGGGSLVPIHVDFPSLFLSDPVMLGSTILDATGEGIGFVFQAPKAGVIDRIWFRTATVTVGCTLDVRVESVASGLPSNNLWAANTNGAQVVADEDDNTAFETVLTAGATVAEGDLVAVTVKWGTGGNLSLQYFSENNPTLNSTLPTMLRKTSASWTKSGGCGSVGVRYNDEEYAYIPGMYAITTGTTWSTYSVSSSPDEVGGKITVPVACTVSGAWLYKLSYPTAGFIRLYDSEDTLIASGQADSAFSSSGSQARGYVKFPTSLELAAGDWCRVVLAPTSGTTTVNAVNTDTVARMKAMPGSGASIVTYRTDSGAWTDVPTAVPVMGLMLSHIS